MWYNLIINWHSQNVGGKKAMLLGTKRLIILTIAEPKFDEDVRTVICMNGIFLKPDNITVKRIEENPSLISELGSPIGLICLGRNGWIDYVINPDKQNKGYATEALKVVKNFSLENNVEPFLAIDDDNLPSIIVAQKCGFKRIAENGTQGRYHIM